MRRAFRHVLGEKGATAIEYALVIAVIVIMVVGTATMFTSPLQGMWTSLGERLKTLVGSGGETETSKIK